MRCLGQKPWTFKFLRCSKSQGQQIFSSEAGICCSCYARGGRDVLCSIWGPAARIYLGLLEAAASSLLTRTQILLAWTDLQVTPRRALGHTDSATTPSRPWTSDLPDALFSQEVASKARSVLSLSPNRDAYLMLTLTSARTPLSRFPQLTTHRPRESHHKCPLTAQLHRLPPRQEPSSPAEPRPGAPLPLHVCVAL